VGGAVDLVGDDETFTDWTADIDDPEVVSFTPGKKDASASFNPVSRRCRRRLRRDPHEQLDGTEGGVRGRGHRQGLTRVCRYAR
jgi:hypothetical protein